MRPHLDTSPTAHWVKGPIRESDMQGSKRENGAPESDYNGKSRSITTWFTPREYRRSKKSPVHANSNASLRPSAFVLRLSHKGSCTDAASPNKSCTEVAMHFSPRGLTDSSREWSKSSSDTLGPRRRNLRTLKACDSFQPLAPAPQLLTITPTNAIALGLHANKSPSQSTPRSTEES